MKEQEPKPHKTAKQEPLLYVGETLIRVSPRTGLPELVEYVGGCSVSLIPPEGPRSMSPTDWLQKAIDTAILPVDDLLIGQFYHYKTVSLEGSPLHLSQVKHGEVYVGNRGSGSYTLYDKMETDARAVIEAYLEIHGPVVVPLAYLDRPESVDHRMSVALNELRSEFFPVDQYTLASDHLPYGIQFIPNKED